MQELKFSANMYARRCMVVCVPVSNVVGNLQIFQNYVKQSGFLKTPSQQTLVGFRTMKRRFALKAGPEF
jgi:hypothetical protein